MEYIERIHDVSTGEIIEISLSKEKLEIMKLNEIKEAELLALENERALAKTALLEKLGLTEDEAKLLLS